MEGRIHSQMLQGLKSEKHRKEKREERRKLVQKPGTWKNVS